MKPLVELFPLSFRLFLFVVLYSLTEASTHNSSSCLHVPHSTALVDSLLVFLVVLD